MKVLWQVMGLVAIVGIVASAAAQPAHEAAGAPPDRTKIAQTIVNQCAAIGPGELVFIGGGPRDLDLLENIAVEVRRSGAQPLLTIETESLVRRMFTDVPAKFDTQEPLFGLRLANIIDVRIGIDFRERLDLLADIAPQRIIDASKAESAVNDALLKRNVRQVYLGNALYPTKALATQFGIPHDELARIFWTGINVDYTQLQATGEKVQKQLAGGNEVKINAANGTNLTVKINGRPVFVSDGVISTKDRADGGPACQVWLPAGEVYLAPVAGTAAGTFIADTYFYEGKLIEGLKLEFKDGRLVNMTAAKGDLEPLKKRYDAAPAGRDQFAFIDLGINPNVTHPKDSRMVCWMAAGMISIGTGGNTWCGGDNDVPFDMYAHLVGATLTVDGKALIDKGKLIVGKIE